MKVCVCAHLLYACTCGGSAAGGRVRSEQRAVKFNLSVNFTAQNSREEYSHCITDVLGSPPFPVVSMTTNMPKYHQ